MVNATVFMQIRLLSFQTKLTHIHANVPGIARYKLSGNILDAVSIILLIMNKDPIHLIMFVILSPIDIDSYMIHHRMLSRMAYSSLIVYD